MLDKTKQKDLGFVLFDILIAIAIFSTILGFIFSNIFSFKNNIIGIINKNKATYEAKNNILNTQAKQKGKIVKEKKSQVFFYNGHSTSTVSLSRYLYDKDSFGKDTCDISSMSNNWQQVSSYFVSNNARVTDVDILNNLVYVSLSENSGKSLMIFDLLDDGTLSSVSNFIQNNGFSSILAIPGFVFVTEENKRYPMSIFDVHNPQSPTLIYRHMATTSSSVTNFSFGRSLHYDNGLLYVGKEKSIDKELMIFDVSDPYNIVLVNSFETNSIVSAIETNKDYIFIATADEYQLSILNKNPISNIYRIGWINFLGNKTAEGKSLYVSHNDLFFGRTVGGVNSVNSHELFHFDISNVSNPILLWSKDIAASVNALIFNKDKLLLAIGNSKNYFSIRNIFDNAENNFNFSSEITSLDCEDDFILVSQSKPGYLHVFK